MSSEESLSPFIPNYYKEVQQTLSKIIAIVVLVHVTAIDNESR